MPRPTGNGGWPYRAEDESAGAPAKTTKPKTPRAPEAVLERIAKEKLALVTLATRRSDRLDFYDLSVWAIRDALQAAYKAGYETAAKKAPMLKAAKRARIRAALYDVITLPYEKMEALVRAWMAFPLATFEESLAAGFYYTDAANPVIKNSHNSGKK